MDHKRAGSVHLITGPMFAAKSTALQEYAERAHLAGKPFAVVRPDVDTRTEHWANHRGVIGRGKPLVHPADSPRSPRVPAPTRLVILDEGQFFVPDALWRWCETWAAQGRDVVVGALDMDAAQGVFEATANVAAIADAVRKLTAVCVGCGENATRTRSKVVGHHGQVLIGGADTYEPVCRTCLLYPVSVG